MEEILGTIKLFAGNFAPQNYMYCNGQRLLMSSNRALYNLLGTTYGGDGITTFGLPDLRSRIPVGGGMGPSPSLQNNNTTLGQVGGEINHTLITTEMPQHSHNLIVNNGKATNSVGANNVAIASPGTTVGRNFTASLGFSTQAPNTAIHPASINSTGGNKPHNNMQPYLGLSYIICVQGLYPSRP
jgi:microcystin-dependent protein